MEYRVGLNGQTTATWRGDGEGMPTPSPSEILEMSVKRLEDYSINERVAITGGFVIGLVLLIALLGWRIGGWNIDVEEGYRVASADNGLQISKYDELIIKLDRDAAANAYREQIEHLFAIWMKDDAGQPARAATGARQARKAFIAVMEAIEKREAELRKLRELSPIR